MADTWTASSHATSERKFRKPNARAGRRLRAKSSDGREDSRRASTERDMRPEIPAARRISAHREEPDGDGEPPSSFPTLFRTGAQGSATSQRSPSSKTRPFAVSRHSAAFAPKSVALRKSVPVVISASLS